MGRVANGASDAAAADGRALVGGCLREARERHGIGVRELARRVEVSASLISQIELGRTMPSVGTLYAIANELSISIDELLFKLPADGGAQRAGPLAALAPDAIVRARERSAIELGSGVRWERMTAGVDAAVDFLYVVYEVRAASAPEDALARHAGKEYGYVLEGRLAVTVGFETHELERGDAIAFESTMPHRLFNPGATPARAIWFVTGRRDDPRFGAGPELSNA